MPDFKVSGSNSLAYLGVRATTPPQMIVVKRAPTQNDVNFDIGTQWLHWVPGTPTTSVQYVLTSIAQNVAVWLPLNGGGDNPTLPNHSVALGTGVPGFNSANTVATQGAALISNGLAADPSFGVVSVSGGGTGLNTTSPYAVYCGGVTGEGPVQQVATLGTIGQVLTSQGNGSLPIWSSAGGGAAGGPINVQVFNMNGTYTPTVGMGSCIVECVGGGGGAAGIAAANEGGTGGGGAGGYSRRLFQAATIGVSQAVTIGGGGAGGVAGTDGTDGGDTTFGAFMTASGGKKSVHHATTGGSFDGGAGGAAVGGDINIPGQPGGPSAEATLSTVGIGGVGGSSIYGAGGLGAGISDGSVNGLDGLGFGSGGSGVIATDGANHDGGSGADGVVIVTEFGPYGPLPPITGTTINIIVLDTPGAGTYTPSAGMVQCVVECQGGGSGAYGALSSNPGGSSVGYSGSSGGYCKKLFDAATIGASQSYVVGAGGLGATVFPNPGQNGGSTTFGAFMSAGGGIAGIAQADPSGVLPAGGIATGGDYNINGQPGIYPAFLPSQFQSFVTFSGANSILGIGGSARYVYGFPSTPSSVGNDATGYGAGGGAANPPSAVGYAHGGNGGPGAIIITEYLS